MKKYFAYGSNMLEQRLKARVPGAVFLAKAYLGGYCLRFHKKSKDGSGKCNIIQAEDLVQGVLYEFPESELNQLDAAEGYGYGYNHKEITLRVPNGTKALAYAVVDFKYIDDKLVPYSWYHELVVSGAEQHGLDADYIEKLRKHRSVQDPDPKRKEKVEAEKVLAAYYATRQSP
jgi:gamma-glutamylcyclotransferase